VELARAALELSGENTFERGLATQALADGLAAGGDFAGADQAYREAVDLLVDSSRWRIASSACRSWGRLLRESGHENRALDVLDRAAELGMRAAPEAARAEH
jgi:hypothetical protein